MLTDPQLLGLPKEFTLGQNFPNPFNPTTTIPFNVPVVPNARDATGLTSVSVEIFNILGQLVQTLVDDEMQPGYYKANWDGLNSAGYSVGTGIYLYRVRVGGHLQVRKMTLLK